MLTDGGFEIAEMRPRLHRRTATRDVHVSRCGCHRIVMTPRSDFCVGITATAGAIRIDCPSAVIRAGHSGQNRFHNAEPFVEHGSESPRAAILDTSKLLSEPERAEQRGPAPHLWR